MPRSIPILSLENIEKRFAGVTALSGVNLTVHPGEVLGLVGENGAGKSTLLSILSGHHSPTSGQITVRGEPTLFSGPVDSLAAGVHVVRQEPTLYPDLSVAENLSIGNLPTRLGRFTSKTRIINEAENRLAASGLAGVLPLGAMVRDLRPSDRQIVEIAKAVINAKPGSVIALDEPTSSLTQENVNLVMRIVRGLRDNGSAVIYVTHRMPELFEIADRFVVLRDGHVVGDVDRAQCNETQLVSMMVGRELSQLKREKRVVAAKSSSAIAVSQLTAPGLYDISLSVQSGEVFGIGGLVKSGRSRLARTLFGDLKITGGHIEVAGARLRLLSPSHALKYGVVLVPEDRHKEGLVLQRSIRENVSLGRLKTLTVMRFINVVKERNLTLKLFKRMRVKAPTIDVEVSTLSGGNQQKVLLSRAIARNPKVLILDEPTRGVDVGAKAEIYELIRDLAHGGTAIILISSELPELLLLSDRVAVMRDGSLSEAIAGSEATEQVLLNLAMPVTNTTGVLT